MSVRAALLTIAAAALAACGDGGDGPRVDPCALATPGAPWLAFASRRTGNYELWRARADGSCLAQLTHDAAADLHPTWAGGAVVFTSERGGALRLWRHDLATGAEAQVDTGSLASATSPALSPDGATIAFEGRAEGAATPDVYLVPAAGGEPVPLASHAATDAGPAWSPDGSTVFFVSARSGRYEVWSVPASGGDAVQETGYSGIVGKPAVAPDGASILFARTRAGAAGTEVVRQVLATDELSVVSSLDDSEPALSPAGDLVAVRSFRAGHADLWILGAGEAAPLPLTDDEPSDGAPSFARP